MSKVYSAHPALAAEQLQRAELESANGRTNSHNRRHHCSSNGKTMKPTPKKYMSRVCNAMTGLTAGGATTAATVFDKRATTNNTTTTTTINTNLEVFGSLPAVGAAPAPATPPQPIQATCTTTDTEAESSNQEANDATTRKTLPDRTNYAAVDDDDISDDDDDDDDDEYNDAKAADAKQQMGVERNALGVTENIVRNTKDCVNQQTAADDGGQKTTLMATSNAYDRTVTSLDSIDETDHVLQRYSSRNGHTMSQRSSHRPYADAQIPERERERERERQQAIASAGVIRESQCISGLSSGVSSPSASTVSSPLSTPTRLAPLQALRHTHEHCCQKATTMQGQQHHRHQQPQHHLHHNHHKQHNNQQHKHKQQQQQQQQHQCKNHKVSAACCIGSRGSCGGGGGGGGHGSGNDGVSTSGCKSKKLDPRLSPSPYRQLLPIVLCILSFAAVFATLIVYMDTTEIRHQQFRLNMSRDYELNGVAQDDPALIAFLRQIHMRKYPMHFLKNRDVVNGAGADAGVGVGGVATITSSANSLDGRGTAPKYLNFSAVLSSGRLELGSAMAYYVANLVGGKTNGAVIQSLTGSLAHLITAPWLSETLDWMGILVEPEPRWYFTLRKENAQRSRMQVVHACVSPNPYPKEITIHNEDVRINSLQEEETSWFNSRVKCFPLYTIMLACDRIEYDLLSLGVQGQELEILQTLPFDKVKIDVISIHLLEDQEDVRSYVQSITKFMNGKFYKLQRRFGRNYFYQRQNSVSRTRKKDILLLKTP